MALAGVGSLGEALVRYHLKRYADNDSFNLRLAALLTVIQLRWEPRWKDPISSWKRFPESGRGADQDRGAGGARGCSPGCGQPLYPGGVNCLLNYAPVKLMAPDTVQVASVDLSLELQRLAYYVPKPAN